MDFLDELILKSECSGECKGVVFRYSRSVWATDDGSFHVKESYRKLKRESCDGMCGENTSTTRCIASMFEDDVRTVGMDVLLDSMELPHYIEHGAKLVLGVNCEEPNSYTGESGDYTYSLSIQK